MMRQDDGVAGDDDEDLRLPDVDQQDHDGDDGHADHRQRRGSWSRRRSGQPVRAGEPVVPAIAKIIRIAPVWFARQQTKIAMATATSRMLPRSVSRATLLHDIGQADDAHAPGLDVLDRHERADHQQGAADARGEHGARMIARGLVLRGLMVSSPSEPAVSKPHRMYTPSSIATSSAPGTRGTPRRVALGVQDHHAGPALGAAKKKMIRKTPRDQFDGDADVVDHRDDLGAEQVDDGGHGDRDRAEDHAVGGGVVGPAAVAVDPEDARYASAARTARPARRRRWTRSAPASATRRPSTPSAAGRCSWPSCRPSPPSGSGRPARRSTARTAAGRPVRSARSTRTPARRYRTRTRRAGTRRSGSR